MNKLGIAAATAVVLTGAASAQDRPGEPAANQPPTSQPPAYAVDGITLGSKLKLDGAMYREYKCSPSEQFSGFTWCQKSRRDSDKHGGFDVIYSILHAKDGTVVYVNRYQHPAFFDANAPDRDIQNYTRKFGGASPQIAKMPRRSGGADGVLATWGDVELVPLDGDSMKVVAEGKSPRKGLLIDFIGNFPGSAQEGLPVYRITGGAGFVWAGTFDQKGRGGLRFAAVNASALQRPAAPAVALQSVTPAATERLPPPPAEPAAPPLVQPAAPLPAAKPIDQPPAAERVVPPPTAAPVAQPPQPPAVEPAQAPPAAKFAVRPPIATQDAEQPPAANPAELAAAVKARRDAEATVARLQSELAVALQAKTDAEQGRAQVEAAARQARSDAEIARKEYEAARNDANAANDEIDRMVAGGMPASVIKGAILIGISAAAVFVFIILMIAQIARWMLAKAEPEIDQDELLGGLAKSLGVDKSLGVEEPPPPPLPPSAPAEGDPPATDNVPDLGYTRDRVMAEQDQMRLSAGGDARSIPSSEASEGPVLGPALAPTGETNGDAAKLDANKSIVPAIPGDGDVESVKPAQAVTASQPENANQS
jgi:hypothetical protein